jgi:hypothetical protein
VSGTAFVALYGDAVVSEFGRAWKKSVMANFKVVNYQKHGESKPMKN